jgi:hypothetical protein
MLGGALGGLFHLWNLGFPSDVPILISTSIALPFLFYSDLDLFSVRVVDVSTFVSVSVGIIAIAHVLPGVLKGHGEEGEAPRDQLLTGISHENQFSRNIFHIADVLILDWAHGTFDPYLLLNSSKVLFGFWIECALDMYAYIICRDFQSVGREQRLNSERSTPNIPLFLRSGALRRLDYYLVGTIVVFLCNFILTEQTKPESSGESIPVAVTDTPLFAKLLQSAITIILLTSIQVNSVITVRILSGQN